MPDRDNIPLLLDTLTVQEGATAVVAGHIDQVVLQSQPTTDKLAPFATLPPLPPAFLERPEYSQPLIDRLLSTSETVAVTAVEGMGGVGKTTVALALCHDARVRNIFPDGIVWLSFGREANLPVQDRVAEVLTALNLHFTVKTEAAYRSALKDKAVLVVLDDIWSTEEIEPFRLGFGRARLLYTSRDKSLAGSLGAVEHEIGVLEESQAHRFLKKWSGRDAVDLPEPHATNILRECNGLVLAIAMVGAALKGQPDSEWADIAADLKAARLKVIGTRPSGYGYQTLYASIAVGIDALDPVARSHYLALALLLEDMPASAVLLRSIWGAEEREARRFARLFVDRCLARRDANDNIVLHDFQLDYIRGEHSDQSVLALERSALQLSLHAVSTHPEEFASQMIGRLLAHVNVPGIATALERLNEFAPKPRLLPQWPTALAAGGPALRVFETVGAWIRAVAISADGSRAITGSEDSLLIWDLNGNKQPQRLQGHTGKIRAVALSPDGQIAASGSEDSTVLIWDLSGCRPPQVLYGQEVAVRGLSISANGLRVVSASCDRTLRVWDLQSGLPPLILRGHADEVSSVAISADGSRVVSGSLDQTARVWDLSGMRPPTILKGHTERIYGVGISADGSLAASASDDRTVRVWELLSNSCTHILEGHAAPVTAVALSAVGRHVVTGSRDKTIRHWSLQGDQPPRILKGHSKFVNSVALSADGQLAISSSLDLTLRVWGLQEDRGTNPNSGIPTAVKSVALSGNGQRAASGSDDKSLRLWKRLGGEPSKTLEGQLGNYPVVALSWDGELLASTGDASTIKIWDMEGPSLQRSLPSEGGQVTALALSGDGKVLVSGSKSQDLSIWKLQVNAQPRVLAMNVGGIKCLALPVNGEFIAIGAGNHTIQIWGLEDEVPLVLKGHRGEVRSISLSGDGRWVASGSLDCSVRFWDLDSRRTSRVLVGHTGPIHAVSISTDGRRIVSGSNDKTLKVWNPYTGKCLATFHCDATVYSCAWAEGKIMAGDATGQVHLFSWEE